MLNRRLPLVLILLCCFGLGLGAYAAFLLGSSQPAAAAQKATFRRLPPASPTALSIAKPTRPPTCTPVPMRTFAPAPTPTNALQPYYVESLRSRAYTRYLIRYDSDGLRITGLMNLPAGDGPFPVIILNHGYFDPSSYMPGDGTQSFADAFASQGYLTLAPDYRLYGQSDEGPDPYRTGFAVDLVNLIVSVGSLPQARADDIGLWGHSMGGGVALEALVISPPGLRAAVLLAPMSGNFAENYSAIVTARGNNALGPDWTIAPNDDPEAYQQLSPINYLQYVSVPVQIHHGQSDQVVPPAWSAQLVQGLANAGKDATFYLYPGAGHSFYNRAWNLCVARTLEFFDSALKAP